MKSAIFDCLVHACSLSDNAPVVRRLQADDGRMLNVNEAK